MNGTHTNESGKGPQIKVVVLVGGPTSGTRFRPLTFDVPKPLVHVAGIPLLAHHINASAQLKEHGLIEVILIGFFDAKVFGEFCSDATKKLGVPVTYLNERGNERTPIKTHLGTAGGLALFQNEILSGFANPNDPANILFILHGDVMCRFPLVAMLNEHRGRQGATGCLLGHQVEKSAVHHYGCLVCEPNTNMIIHYVEKPTGRDVLSDTVNCGVYLFSLPKLYTHLEQIKSSLAADDMSADLPTFVPVSSSVMTRLTNSSSPPPTGESPPRAQSPYNYTIVRLDRSTPYRGESEEGRELSASGGYRVRIQMEHDLLPLLADERQLYVHHLNDWWVAIKHPAAALDCSYHVMQTAVANANLPYEVQYQTTATCPNVIGNVFIHPTAQVHPTARIGPNVSICENAIVGAGVRIANSIVFGNTRVLDRSCILYSIICGECNIGKWARVEGIPKGTGITVIGKGVDVSNEVLLRSVIVLPHKSVTENTENTIIL